MEDTIKILQQLEKNKKLDLGIKWQEEELEIFLQFFKDSQLQNLDVMQISLKQAGYNRSITNICSLYLKNKNFLNINKNCTSQELEAILADYYDTIAPQIQHQQTPRAIYEIDQSLKEQQSAKKYNEEIQYDNQRQKKIYIKKPKYSPDRQFIDDRFTKIEEKIEIFKRKKKLQKGIYINDKENDPIKRIQSLELLTRNCGGKNLKKQKNKFEEEINIDYVKWIEHEFFYCHIDKPFFENDEFKDMLQKAGFAEVQQYTMKNLSIIRKAMGKPRRFSKFFINSEIKKLNKYRYIVRKYLQDPINYNIENGLRNKFILDNVKKLESFKVGQVLIAVHPVCGHFHQGQILTANGQQIIIKFFTNELGVHKISDTKLSLEYPTYQAQEYLKTENQQLKRNISKDLSQSENNEISQQMVLHDLDHQAMAFLIKLLDRKTILINQLKEYNDIAEQKQEQVNEQFYQEYGWTGVMINLLDDALKHALAKFRLRGLNNYNDPQMINKNLDRILKTPLNYIENQLENTMQDSKKKILLQQFKLIQNRQIEEKIKNQLGEIIQSIDFKQQEELGKELEKNIDDNEDFQKNQEGYSKYIHNDMVKDKVQDLRNLVYNCMGVLMTLKQQEDVNITENRFIKGLSNVIFSDYPQHFHEIHDAILNITSRNK